MPILNRPPANYKPPRKSAEASEQDSLSKPAELHKIISSYRKEYQELIQKLIKDRGSFVPSRTDTLKTNIKLYAELGAAYTTYQLIKAFINRADGTGIKPVYDNLHNYYNNGLLVASISTTSFGDLMGVNNTTIGRHLKLLEAAGFIRTFRFKGKYFVRARKTLVLFGWYTSSYVGSHNKIIEFYFEDMVDNVDKRISDIAILKKEFQRKSKSA